MRISDWSSDVCSSDLTHTLDPYRPIERLDSTRPIDADAKTLQVEVVALDWKWLFIYPQYGVATVNELAAPIDTPIKFHITAARKSVVQGKSVSVRVDRGGSRHLHKNHTQENNRTT